MATGTLTAKQVEELENSTLRANTRVRKIKEESEVAVMRIVAAAEISTAAFTMGVIDGRYGGVEVLGVPLSLGLAGTSHLIAFLPITNEVAAEHMHNFGNGFLASYLSNLGNGVGAKMAMEAQAALTAHAAQATQAAAAAQAQAAAANVTPTP